MEVLKRLLHSITETMQLIGLGRTKIYELVNAGELTLVRAGSKSLITRQSIDDYIAKCVAVASAERKEGKRPIDVASPQRVEAINSSLDKRRAKKRAKADQEAANR